MSAKGNPKFSCPSILSHSNSKSLGACSKTDSREKLFDSSLKTVNVSVNTEIPMDLSYGPRKRVRDYFHFYEQMDYDDDTSSTMSVDDLTYSTLFNDEVVDNGERHAGLKPCDTGLETCDELKPTRHGNELLDNSIQSAGTKESSGIDNIAYWSGDDTGGTGHTQVYESRENMLDNKSISENQSESDMDLIEDISSYDEIYSDTDDGEYFSTEESLEEILDFGSFTSSSCTVVSFQDKHSLTDLDPGTALRSSEVPDPWDRWEDVDLVSLCVFDEMPMEIYDQNTVHSSPVGFVSSSVDIIDYVDILRRHSSLELLLFAKSPDCDDAVSFCSILTDKLQYCQSDTPDSVRYFSNDPFKAMNAKQRFFDAAFNNEPCNGSTYINSYSANSVPKHQLFDVMNSNIQNKNVLNNAEATAVSNIPSKVSRIMFSPTIFLQYEKDEYESYDNDNSYRKVPAINTYGITNISGKGNVEDVIVKYLIIRKDDVIPCSETIIIMTVFYGHILYMIWKSYVNLCAGESGKVVLGNLIMKYYFPEVVNLLKECVECYMTIVIYCVMMVQISS